MFQKSQFKLSFKYQCQISVSRSHCLFYYYSYCVPWKKSIYNILFLKICSRMLICPSIYLLYCFYCNSIWASGTDTIITLVKRKLEKIYVCLRQQEAFALFFDMWYLPFMHFFQGSLVET